MMDDVIIRWLSGCTESRIFPNGSLALEAITRLATCPTHNGTHHFAVFSDGCGIALSITGIECLEEAGLID